MVIRKVVLTYLLLNSTILNVIKNKYLVNVFNFCHVHIIKVYFKSVCNIYCTIFAVKVFNLNNFRSKLI